MDGVGNTGRFRLRHPLRYQRRSARPHPRPLHAQRRHAPALEALPQGPEEGWPLNKLPNTTTGRKGGRYRVGPALLAVCFAVLLLAGVVSLWPAGFTPGEDLVSPGAQDIAVSREDTMYPASDRLRFDGGVEEIYVYLRVENLATYGDLEAGVERTSRTSALVASLSSRMRLRSASPYPPVGPPA